MNDAKKQYLLKELSVFFPAYNEEENIQNTVEEAVKVLKDAAKNWEVIVVNDGSTDKTGKIVEKLIKKYPQNVKMITHNPNRGYGAALKSGLYSSKYKYIAFTDSDGQFKFDEIYNLISSLKENTADIVIGYRIKRMDPLSRVILASMLKIWNLIWYGVWFKDADCAFKLFKKEIIDEIPPLKTESAITTTEFLIRAKKAGFKFAQVGVHHYPRTAGTQTGSNPKVILKAAKDSLKLWKALH